jgi:nitrogen fixation protein NifU and related proteins
MTTDWKKLYQKKSNNPADDLVYTEKALDHFTNPRNVGRIDNYNGAGSFGDPACGDYLEMTVRVDEHDRIADIGFLVYGCAGAIATTSIITEMVKGRTVTEALDIADEDVIEALDGLPEAKQHCSLLGLNALKLAVSDAMLARYLIGEEIVEDYSEYRRLKNKGKIGIDLPPEFKEHHLQ